MTTGSPSNKVDQKSQPAGIPAHDPSRGGESRMAGPDGALLDLHAELCELVPDADERSGLLGVATSVDAAWSEGRMIPVLRAKRRVLEGAIANASRQR